MAIKATQTQKVQAYMDELDHPKKDVMVLLRETILKTDKNIGEEIKWNAPTFFYSGELEESSPKEYKRVLVVSNFSKKDCIRLVFLKGGDVEDSSNILEGDCPDGRRLAMFCDHSEVTSRKKELRSIIRAQIKNLLK